MAMSFSSCTRVAPGADEEAVLIMQPWIFGHGGVSKEPVETGLEWCAPTTDYRIFKISPVAYEVFLDDIVSDENTPLDFNMVIILRVIKGKSPILLQNYGEYWYENSIKSEYVNRAVYHISNYSPFDLTSNRDVLAKIDSMVRADMMAYIAKLSEVAEFPVLVEKVITGKAIPNEKQMNEMNNTAAQIQAKQTQERRAEMEVAREKAERQRAIADKAYMREMNLSVDQFIGLKAWEVIGAKKDANIDVLYNVSDGATKMWNINKK